MNLSRGRARYICHMAYPRARRWPDLGGLPPHHLSRDLRAVAQTELGVDVREVDLHGAAGDEHALTDLRVRQPGGTVADNLELGRRETLPARGRPLARSASAAHICDRLIERQRFALAARVRQSVVAERLTQPLRERFRVLLLGLPAREPELGARAAGGAQQARGLLVALQSGRDLG